MRIRANHPSALIWVLTLIGIGLCLASSGWDGTYLSRYMPTSAPWLGYVLNTVMDVATQALTYAWGKLRQCDKRSKPYRLAALLIPVEIASVLASWFLSWRQLLIVMPSTEGANTWWVALIVASFTPLLLAGIGLALSLLTGKWEVAQPKNIAEPATTRVAKIAQIAEPAIALSEHGDNGSGHACPYCSKEFGSKQAVGAHLRWCAIYKEQRAKVEVGQNA